MSGGGEGGKKGREGGREGGIDQARGQGEGKPLVGELLRETTETARCCRAYPGPPYLMSTFRRAYRRPDRATATPASDGVARAFRSHGIRVSHPAPLAAIELAPSSARSSIASSCQGLAARAEPPAPAGRMISSTSTSTENPGR
jgi:hypothetical protein